MSRECPATYSSLEYQLLTLYSSAKKLIFMLNNQKRVVLLLYYAKSVQYDSAADLYCKHGLLCGVKLHDSTQAE